MKTKIDVLTLTDIAEYPAVREADAVVQQATRLQKDAEQAITEARAELTAAEQAAATGTRDDRRLRAAHEGVVRAESDLRIAKARVTNANAALTRSRQQACIDIDQEFRQLHKQALRRLADALTMARDYNYEVAALETASSRIFVGGPYRFIDHPGLTGRPLPRYSWNKVFGSQQRAGETRIGFWLQHVSKYLKKGA